MNTGSMRSRAFFAFPCRIVRRRLYHLPNMALRPQERSTGRGGLFRSRTCERKVWNGSWPTPFFLRLGGIVPSRPRENWSWGRVEILNGGEKVTLTKAFFAALSLVVLATSASAEVVCNREGDCWHVREHAWIRPEHELIIHPHDWKWEEHERERYRWREHEGEGRGYWREGRWIEIR